jgi:protein phosphatase 1G
LFAWATQRVTDLRVICERLLRHAQPTVLDMTVILIQFKHDAPDAAEGTEEEDNHQEIKSDASDGEIKLAASDEEQRPFAPNG